MKGTRNHLKYLEGHDTYKYVSEYLCTRTNIHYWCADLYNPRNGKKTGKFCGTSKEAAKAVDMFRIKLGLDPINILKKVSNENQSTIST